MRKSTPTFHLSFPFSIMKFGLFFSVIIVLVGAFALASAQESGFTPQSVSLDLSTFVQRGDPSYGEWNFDTSTNSVVQVLNNEPTFYVSPQTYIDTTIQGQFAVETSGDDDFIGFVIGFQSPTTLGGADEYDYEFILFDWKQTEQTFSGSFAPEGFTLRRVNGTIDTAQKILDSMWGQGPTPEMTVLATDHGTNRGWEDNTAYTFTLNYYADYLEIYIDDGGVQFDNELIFDVSGSFPAGNFGFYNYSQASVRYGGFIINQAPQTGDDTYETPINTPLVVDAANGVLANDIDPEADPITATLLTSPGSAQSFNFNADGSFSYTPSTGYSGTDTFSYAASDGENLSSSATVSINVLNPMPIASDDLYTAFSGQTFTVDASVGVLTNDVDPNEESLTAALIDSTTNGSLTLNSDGSFTYTPNVEFIGKDTFTYTANDTSSSSLPATVTLYVIGDTFGELVITGNTTMGNILPTFTFILPSDGEGGILPVEWINILITDINGSVILDHWFPYDRHCDGVFCSFTLTSDLLPAWTLLAGDYFWKVRTWHPSTGVTGFSDEASFPIDVEAPGIPQNIEVVVDATGIHISWDADPLAAWYRIILRVLGVDVSFYDEWFNIEDLNCTETRCTFTLPLDPETVAIINGNYTVEIQAWGAGGFNGGSADNSSGEIDWDVNLGESGAPGIPAGGADWAITNTKTGSPTFRWTPAENATWHLLWVGRLDPTPATTRYAYWVPVSDMDCPEGVTGRCTYTPDNMFLTAEDYTYEAWLLPWGPGDGSNPFGELGKWTEFVDFDVIVDPPGIATPMTPTDTTLNNGIVTFQWDHVPDVTWYNVWVGTFDNSGEEPVYETHHFEWHRARENGCLISGTCTINPEDLYLTENDYLWFILTYNPAGLGEWSQPGEFTVDRP